MAMKDKSLVRSGEASDEREGNFKDGNVSKVSSSVHNSSNLRKIVSVVLISIIVVVSIAVNSMEIGLLNTSSVGVGELLKQENDTFKTAYYYNFVVDFMVGGVSGAVSKTCTAPIERVKLLIQTQDANPLILSGKVLPYRGIGDCFRRVFQEQGLKSFWRGNFANIIRYFPTQAFNFAFKDIIKSLFPKVQDKKKEFWKFFGINIASGGLAGAGSLLVVYPLDYARTRLATDVGYGNTQRFKSLWHCISETYRNGGIQGLYNGIGVSIAGIIPYRGVYFGLYDTISEYNPYQHVDNAIIRASSKFVVAQFSSIVAAYASYPFDTIRRRLQMQSEIPRDEWIYKGTVDCFAKIMKDEGFLALYKGAGANTIRTIGAALVLVLYSEITAFF